MNFLNFKKLTPVIYQTLMLVVLIIITGISVYYYNNFLSQIYLSCFSGELTKNFYAKFLNRIKINYMISIIENLTPNIEFLNSKLIIVGEKKKSTGNKKIKFKFKRLNKFI